MFKIYATHLYNVTIEAQVYDINGTFIYMITGSTIFTATLPNQLNMFDITIPEIENYDGSKTSEISMKSWSLIDDPKYLPLTVVITETMTDPGVGVQAFVEFRNDTPYPLAKVRGAVWTIYQSNPSHAYLIADYLLPGETITMTKYLYGADGLASQLNYAAQGYIVYSPLLDGE